MPPDPVNQTASSKENRLGAPTYRLEFANQLRGLAALLVAVSHLVGVFWAMRVFVAAATFSPVQPGALPGAYGLIAYRWFEFGPFGVALFFLISGLVVPFSLLNHTRWTFFLARVLRIYPLFITAILLEMLLLYGASRYWHIPFAYNARTIIAECLLISNMTGYPVIDFVSWTLAIEVKFYLLIIVIAPAIRQGRVSVLFSVAALLVGLDALLSLHLEHTNRAHMPPILTTFGTESPYLIFMLIGVLFHFYHAGHFGRRIFAGAVILMTLLFIVSWRLSPQSAQYPIVTVNYLYAVMLFGLLYFSRGFIPDNRMIGFMAAISYPFYVIHAVIGFTIMKYLMVSLQMNYYGALAFALAAIFAFATLLHRTVENWTVRAGRHLARTDPRTQRLSHL